MYDRRSACAMCLTDCVAARRLSREARRSSHKRACLQVHRLKLSSYPERRISLGRSLVVKVARPNRLNPSFGMPSTQTFVSTQRNAAGPVRIFRIKSAWDLAPTLPKTDLT